MHTSEGYLEKPKSEEIVQESKKLSFFEQKEEDRVKSFFEFIQHREQQMREIIYMVHASVEKIVTSQKEKQIINYNRIIKEIINITGMSEESLPSTNEIKEIVDPKSNVSNKVRQSLRALGSSQHHLASNISQRFDQCMKELLVIRGFERQEEKLMKIMYKGEKSMELYHFLFSLCYVGQFLLRNDSKKIAVQPEGGNLKYATLGDLFASATDSQLSIGKKPIQKLEKYFKKLEGRDYSVHKSYNLISHSVHESDFKYIMKKAENELTEQEKEILHSFTEASLQKDRFTFGYQIHKNKNEDIEADFDKILEYLFAHFWVDAKVDGEFKNAPKISTNKARKKRATEKKQAYSVYKELFYELDTPWKKINENESFEAEEVEVISQNEVIDLPENYTNDLEVERVFTDENHLENILEEIEYQKYKNLVPDHMQFKVNTILNNILRSNNSRPIANNVFHMKYSDDLPFINNQYGQMRFKGKTYDDCLKLNVTKGDRLLVYKEDNQIKMKFLTAQQYHRDRS